MMIAINIVTAICFILLTCAVAYVVWAFFNKKDRKQRIAFVRSFKKGKCLAILLISIPLLAVGYIYKGMNVIDGIFSGVTHMVELVVLKFGLDKVSGLTSANLFYRITLYYTCILVTLNAILFAISLLSQGLWHFKESVKFNVSKKDKVYIFGNNKESLMIYDSNKDSKCAIVDDLNKDDCVELYMQEVHYISTDDKNVVESIFKKLDKSQNKLVVVINTNDDERNLKICRMFLERIGKIKNNPVLFRKLSINFFCDPRYEAICNSLVKESKGCLHYKNKYQMIATNFIEKYPFASFMTEDHIDYDNSLIKENVDINVCMIGFGKTNRQIFLTSVANNQFLTKNEKCADGVELKQVNYHIFDKNYAEHNKNLNHSYYRYRNECLKNDATNPQDYLPLPQLPAKEFYYHMDVNDTNFYDNIKNAIVERENKNVNFVIIAFNTDLENIDMATKLVEKRNEWGIDNMIIFVKTRKAFESLALFTQDNKVIPIGNEKDNVYNIEEITNDAIYNMAKKRHMAYKVEGVKNKKEKEDKNFVVNYDNIKKIEDEVESSWYEQEELKRKSSVYACLSLKSKLNLMGLDYCKKNDNIKALSYDEYMNIYAIKDKPGCKEVNGRHIASYTLDFKPSKRNKLAIQEHYRWNSYMISNGIVPSTKAQILGEENGKNYDARRHGNLTTFEGLVEFRQMVAKQNGEDELNTDVIKYDYQLLDDAYWLLNSNGYQIIYKGSDVNKTENKAEEKTK